jgi:hypothetical protein
MTTPTTIIALSPLVDRTGTVLHDATGVPLAADGDGLVYTMTNDAGPTPLGELAEDDAGRVVLVPLGALDPEDKGHKLTRLGRRRAHLRGRIAHHEGRLRRLTGAGAQPGDRRIEKHAGRIESLRAQLAQVQAELEAANAEALNGLGDLADDTDDMQGLGSFKDFWTKNRKLIGGIGIGAAGTALVGSAMNPNSGLGKGVRAVPGLLKNFFVGDGGAAAAGDPTAAMMPAPMQPAPMPSAVAMPVEAAPTVQRAGLGGIPTWALIAGAAAVGLMLLKRRSA